MPRRFFVADTGLLWNFAVIDRLDLLIGFVHSTGTPPVWAEKVRSEVEYHIPEHLDALDQIFGEPLVPEGDERGLVFEIRDNFFAGNDDGPAQHLGESESVAICASRFESEIVFMLTEDTRVRDFCTATRTPRSRHMELVFPQAWYALVTRSLLQTSVKQEQITDEQRIAYLAQLEEAKRPLIDPPRR